MKQTKISIIGAGMVGSTIAYALGLRGVPADVYLVDPNQARCRGEILDLSDSLAFCGPSIIQTESIKTVGKSDIIIISAGARQEPGQDRVKLLATNKDVIKQIIHDIGAIQPNAIIIMVTNPLDVLTLYAQELTKLPRSQIFGTGTFLDTQRLRGILAQKLDVAIQSIHAYILGEHGDTQFPAWSCAYVAGIPLLSFAKLTKKELDQIAQETRNKAYEIISCKGATYWGIGTCVATICNTIILDQKRVTPLSCYVEPLDVCLSMPVVLGKRGIEKILSMPLNKHEQEQLELSAQTLRSYLR